MPFAMAAFPVSTGIETFNIMRMYMPPPEDRRNYTPRALQGCHRFPRCRGKVESSALRIVTDVIILLFFSAIPSMNIVLHRPPPAKRPLPPRPPRRPAGVPRGGHPGRGPEGTRPRCEETRSGMREWQVLLWLVVQAGSYPKSVMA